MMSYKRRKLAGLLLRNQIFTTPARATKESSYYLGPYVLGLLSIWSLHFDSSQFGLCYFQLRINLVPTANSLTKNVYVANSGHGQHI